MKIGFDAKRIFFNRSGLGNYSRGTVDALAAYYPDNEYVLFSPKPGNPAGYRVPDGIGTVYPRSGWNRRLSSLWRSYNMAGSLRRAEVELYHGLSNELPMDIRRSGARSVLTMHDIIFVRFPELYKPLDRWLYTRKYRSSCFRADRIIAISRQTMDDLVNVWQVPEAKIDVVYQGCDPMFCAAADEEKKRSVRERYALPEHYILSVGTIEERKNLLLTVRAMAEGGVEGELVACGRATPYADEIKRYAERHGIARRLHFIHNLRFEDLPAVYQMADVMVYASLYEGFGIPILEGLNSGVPVITSEGGVFPETGGDACYYVDPRSPEGMVVALRETLGNTALREAMIRKGREYALRFREEEVAKNLMAVYRKVL